MAGRPDQDTSEQSVSPAPDSASRGLTSVEAAERLASADRNQAPQPKPPSLVSRVLGQLRDPMILLLMGARVVVPGCVVAAARALSRTRARHGAGQQASPEPPPTI